MGGFKARAKSECALSITGADCGATLNGKSIRLNEIVWMNEGDELELAFARDGARAYVEVHKYTHTLHSLEQHYTSTSKQLRLCPGRSGRTESSELEIDGCSSWLW